MDIQQENTEAEEAEAEEQNCEACEWLRKREQEWLYTGYTKDKKAALKDHLQTRSHTWTDDCVLATVVEESRYTRNELEEFPHEANVDFHRGVLWGSLSFRPTEEKGKVRVLIELGKQ